MRKIPSLHSITTEQITNQGLAFQQIAFSGFDSIASTATIISDLLVQGRFKGPFVVILPTESTVEQFIADLRFFAPEVSPFRLTGFDVSPFSGLYSSQDKIAQRLGWLFAARSAKGQELFVGSSEFFQQKVPPPDFFKERVLHLQTGDALPTDFPQTLLRWGYIPSPIVEEVGQFAIKGGIIDIYSACHPLPIRVELFGDEIESMRTFDIESQMSLEGTTALTIIPAREVLLQMLDREQLCQKIRLKCGAVSPASDHIETLVRHIARGEEFPGLEFLTPLIELALVPVTAHFVEGFTLFEVFPDDINSAWQASIDSHEQALCQHPDSFPGTNIESFYLHNQNELRGASQKIIQLERVHIDSHDNLFVHAVPVRLRGAKELTKFCLQREGDASSSPGWQSLMQVRDEGNCVIIGSGSETQARRLCQLLEHRQLKPKLVLHGEQDLRELIAEQRSDLERVHVVVAPLSSSFQIEDDGLFMLSEDLLLGKASVHRARHPAQAKSNYRVFASTDLSPNDFVVHAKHGIGIFEGLKRMSMTGVEAEYIQIRYRDNDRLYLPIYRIGQLQKYAVGHFSPPIDKLGSGSWEKTKVRVRNHLHDIANELLKLYSERKLVSRAPFPAPDDDFLAFESSFPYDETPDQERSIEDILEDLGRDFPMDRVVCGDVGFGKTEVAMRAAFKVTQSGKQVAVLAPTTVLSFQHLRTFRQRFANWPITIDVLNRFVPPGEQKATLARIREGKVDIVIGTHRLLSQDLHFANLGLMVIDEEHRFGVKQKERLKKIRLNVDCLSLSATPIPRTLNMSFLGIRDLSIIATPPSDRHPIRTFLQTYSVERAAKTIQQEVARGGQVYFIHNRIKSIYGIFEELRVLLPDLRIRVAHGQMAEGELEKIMIDFFEGRIDVLICTTIVESGVDVARANTMLIHDAHTFGLSQLYQLRGRIGRSKQRAYCYLFVPPNLKLDRDAQERLKIMQAHTALGSGFYISQHDLELRGAGNLLGEEQSGHIQAVGYELYIELLEEALYELRHKEPFNRGVDPEINLKIPALIPDAYIPDIRIRLTIYKELSTIHSEQDITIMERRLSDQFGTPPEAVINLLGVMLIRHLCKELCILDISGGAKSITLKVTEETPIEPQAILELQSRHPHKYALASGNRLRIAMHGQGWTEVYEELRILKRATTALE